MKFVDKQKEERERREEFTERQTRLINCKLYSSVQTRKNEGELYSEEVIRTFIGICMRVGRPTK